MILVNGNARNGLMQTFAVFDSPFGRIFLTLEQHCVFGSYCLSPQHEARPLGSVAFTGLSPTYS